MYIFLFDGRMLLPLILSFLCYAGIWIIVTYHDHLAPAASTEIHVTLRVLWRDEHSLQVLPGRTVRTSRNS